LYLYKEHPDKNTLVNALNTFKLSDQVVNTMQQSQFGEKSKLYWRNKMTLMYEEAIETCYLLNDDENAFYFFERSRAALLNEKLNDLRAKKYLSQNDIAKKQFLSQKLFSLQQALINKDETFSDYNAIRLQCLQVQDELEKFVKHTEDINPSYYRYKYDTTVYGISDVRSKLLNKDQSLIEYFNGDSSIYVFVITLDKTFMKKIDFKGYKDIIDNLLMYCSDKSLLNREYSSYLALVNKVYIKLFQPLALSAKRIIISPDGNFIPFDILLKNPTDDNSLLVNDFAFSYTYSAASLIKSTKRNGAFKNAFLGIAPVYYQSTFKKSELPNSDVSLNTIAPCFSSAILLVNEQATKGQFLKDLRDNAVILLYTHADTYTEKEDPIIYFYDSILKVSELQLLRDSIAARLVILSACNTAAGIDKKGEGIFSFARGIAEAGIASTVATLWPVDNQSTYQLTESFLKNLSEGLPGDIALQKAKKEFIQTNDVAKQLPYFWGASILIGEANINNNKELSFHGRVNYIIPLASFFLLIAFGMELKFRNKYKK
jgi:CHAT domain-containing protein